MFLKFFALLQIVALPYNTLLHKSTRQASGIQLKDNIVVIDEAHNLLETINNIHSMELTGAQVIDMTPKLPVLNIHNG